MLNLLIMICRLFVEINIQINWESSTSSIHCGRFTKVMDIIIDLFLVLGVLKIYSGDRGVRKFILSQCTMDKMDMAYFDITITKSTLIVSPKFSQRKKIGFKCSKFVYTNWSNWWLYLVHSDIIAFAWQCQKNVKSGYCICLTMPKQC